MKWTLRLTAVVLAGILYGLCFPPVALRPLAWVALVPLLVAIRRTGYRGAAGLAIVFSGVATYATVDWLPRTVATYSAQPLGVGVAVFVAVWCTTVLPWVTAWGLWYRVLGARPSVATPWLAAAGWVSAELARATCLTGNPWVLFGYAQVGVDPIVQVADLTGVYGISFVLVAVNAALAELWLAGRDRRSVAPAWRGCAVAAAVVALMLAYGAQRLVGVRWESADLIGVAAAQGNVDFGRQWDSSSTSYSRMLEVYQRLTAKALAAEPARLVVWPENAMTFFLADEPGYQAALASVLQPWNAELIAGGVYKDGATPPRFYNSAFAVAHDGRILGRYDKQRLLPFAEYVPLPQLDFVRRDFGGVPELTASRQAALLPSPVGPAGVLICNEALFGSDARRRVLAGAAVLINLSNDSWMHDDKFSAIAFDMSALRAVEQRRFLVRASTSGPSAVVDPLGRVTARSALSSTEVITGRVAPMALRTLYAEIGDVFAYACAGLTVAALLLALAQRR
jgi:apolipoprotein N-acyltransferase